MIRKALQTCIPLLLLLSCGDEGSNVDETGYFNGDQVYYSSASPLSPDTQQDVFIVGAPDAVGPPGGRLIITNLKRSNTSEVPKVETSSGTFAITIGAVANDDLEIIYYLGDTTAGTQIVLSDSLEDEMMPQVCLVCVGQFLTANPDGTITVGLSLIQVTMDAPLLLFNETSGDVRLVETGRDQVILAGKSGDRVCAVVQSEDRMQSSPAYCDVVP